MLNAVVISRYDLPPGLIILRVKPDGWTFPQFEAGQYVSLGLPASAPRSPLAQPESLASEPEKLIRRAYSIASSPQNREFLEFYINLVPAGALTPRLFNLKIGDRIWLGSKVAGSFTLKSVPDRANLILIATGTGLAPYVSMLTSDVDLTRRHRIALLHGVRCSGDLGYRSLLTGLQDQQPNFNYVPIVSRPQLELTPWPGVLGHVQDVWQTGELERAWRFLPNPENTHIFLCGNPEMIESMTALLARDGFLEQTPRQPGQIHAERYWPINRRGLTVP